MLLIKKDNFFNLKININISSNLNYNNKKFSLKIQSKIISLDIDWNKRKIS